DAVALEGSFNVTLADGSRVECKPAWQMWLDRVDKYTPELAERITWVPRERVIEAAHIWGTHRPAVMARGVAPEQSGRTCSSIEVCRIMMHTLNGSIDVEGGDVLTVPGPHGPNGELFIREQMLQAEEAISQEQKRKQIGCGTHKVQTWTAYDVSNPHYKRRWGIAQPMAGHMMQIPPHALPRQILSQDPYPIKAVISFASNAFLWMPNTKLVHKAVKSPNLELHVVLEHWMTPTAQLADYVLPMASKVYERPYCGTMEDFTSLLTVWDQAVPPLGERRTEYDFFRGLALRLGLGEYFPWETLRESMEHRLKPLGLTFEEAAKRRVIFDQFKPRTYEETNPKTSKPLGFGTPSGRAELYSSVYEALGYDPLPFYEEPAESPLSTPMLAKEYPLILTTGGRFRPQFHSENRQLGLGLREMNPYPQCDIHYQTARELSISNGDWVWIETRRGRIKQKARVTANILPGVVNVQHNWWYPELPGEEPWLHGGWISNANVLTSDEPETLDPMIGAWFYRGLLCRAYRADGGPPVPGP
ncbi:MAG: molybdopterin-dependent oxidoreductase, partial [Candidatus Bathyarchaeia archaeon]